MRTTLTTAAPVNRRTTWPGLSNRVIATTDSIALPAHDTHRTEQPQTADHQVTVTSCHCSRNIPCPCHSVHLYVHRCRPCSCYLIQVFSLNSYPEAIGIFYTEIFIRLQLHGLTHKTSLQQNTQWLHYSKLVSREECWAYAYIALHSIMTHH